MFFRIKNRWRRHGLNRTQRGVLQTPTVRQGREDAPSVLSMVRADDLYMYLLAIKSFAHFCPPRRVYILNDGTLDQNDIACLCEHIPFADILDIGAFQSVLYPQDNCWERLAALVCLSAEGYIMQLDADTMTLSMPDEVAAAVSLYTPFTLGSAQGKCLMDVEQVASVAQEFLRDGDTHVQVLAESKLGKITGKERLRYVRGCAAFTGVPQGALDIDTLSDWSRRFEEKLGERWYEWGTEQFMSNFLIANLDGAQVLPHPKYSTCPPRIGQENAFIHFAGYCRFSARRYHTLSRDAIVQLRADAGTHDAPLP